MRGLDRRVGLRGRGPARAGLLAVALLAVPAAARAQNLADDPFAAHLLGDWEGSGVYQGNTLTLTRGWTIELNSFLRADMRVAMPNGASFGAVTYWKRAGADTWTVLWLDGTGRMQTLQALRNANSGIVAAVFLDQQAEGGPAWRRWEFEATGRDAYVERLFGFDGEEWRLLTEFRFERR